MKTLIISECGINHMGDVELGKRLIEESKYAGCDIAKFQTYKTDERVAANSPIYDVLEKCEMNYEQQKQLKIHADKVGIEFASTPFDAEALEFLIGHLGCRTVKVASFDLTNAKLLKVINEYAISLPALRVVISTGMATWREIGQAIKCLPNVGDLSILHCVSAYPTPEEQVNLSAIGSLNYLLSALPYKVGYSDHTSDILAPTLAVVAGAQVIEKHFTLDLNNGAPDNPVSADPEMMKNMVDVIRLHEKMMGDGKLMMRDIEGEASTFRRYS